MKILKRLIQYINKPPSTNYNLRQLQHSPYAALPEGAIILDIGSSKGRARYEGFPYTAKTNNLFCLDVVLSEGVDLAGDAQVLPIKDSIIDAVFCVSMLQYVRRPQQAIDEIFRVLKPGGVLYLNVPFVFRYAPEPKDLYRFSMNGLRIICSSFEEIQTGYNRGPASTMCDLLVHFSAILFSFNSNRAYSVLIDLFQWGFFWFKYFDRWIGHYKTAHIICSGVFFFGRKPYASG